MVTKRSNQPWCKDCDEEDHHHLDVLLTKKEHPSNRTLDTTHILLRNAHHQLYWLCFRHLFCLSTLFALILIIFNLSSTLLFVCDSNRGNVNDINLLYELGKEISSSIQRYNDQHPRDGQLLYWIGGTTSLAAARNIPSGLFKSDNTYHFYFPKEQVDQLQSAFSDDHPILSLKWSTSLGHYRIMLKRDVNFFGNLYPVEWNTERDAFEWINEFGKVGSNHRFKIPDKNVAKYLAKCRFYDYTFQCMKMAETEQYLSEVYMKNETTDESFINDEDLYQSYANEYDDYSELLPALTHKLLDNMRGMDGIEDKVKDNEDCVKEGIFRRFSNSLLLTYTKSKFLGENDIDGIYDIAENVLSTINEYNIRHPDDPFIFWISGGTTLAATRNSPSGIFQWDDDLDFSYYEGTNEKLIEVFPASHPTLKLQWCEHCTFYKIRLKSNGSIFADFLPVRWNNETSSYGFIEKAQHWFPTQHFYFPTPNAEDHLVECPFYDFSLPCQKLSDRLEYLSNAYKSDNVMTHAHFKSHRGVHGYYDLRTSENFHFLQPALTHKIVKKMQAFSFIE